MNISQKNTLKAIISIICFSVIFFTYLMQFDGPASGYWDTYIAAPALLMINNPVDFTSTEGASLYQYTLPEILPENLVDNDTYGVISKDQRIGSAIMVAPFALFFNIFGFRFFYALSMLLIALFIFLATQKLTENFYISCFMSLLATLNGYMVSLLHLNPNIIGMMIISLILFLLLTKEPHWFIVGLVFGTLGGVRNIAILFAPAIIYRLMTASSHKKKDFLLFCCGSLLTIAPILYWKNFAFGNIFMHPSQFSDHAGFRPVFEHQFLFWKFYFNGMFNFPLYEKIIRTPYFAFPTFITLPLTIINAFGVIASTLMFIGLFCMFQKNKKEALFLALWFLPMYFIFSIQENWSELKTTFLLLFINPVIIWIAYGMHILCTKRSFLRTVSVVCAASIIMSVTVRSLFYLDFEIDNRWYERFPRALEDRMSFVGDDLRTKPENINELMAQKRRLTDANLLPELNAPTISLRNSVSAMESELNNTTLTTVDYWKYIYGEDI